MDGQTSSAQVVQAASDADTGTQTVALTLAYDGSAFSGFARQVGQSTVQGELESALAVLARRPIETVGAGRTDAGVHARGQVVSCALPTALVQDRSRLRKSLNALTPAAMVVRAVTPMSDTFNARFDARARTYVYRIAQGLAQPLFLAPYCWYVAHPLDIEAMRHGAAFLIGEHDFASFCVAKSAAELHERDLSTFREVTALELASEEILGERMLTLIITGNAFLHSMIRVIVGTLVEVGRGVRAPEWVGEVLAAQDRRCAGQTAPAHGLMLWEVDYGEVCLNQDSTDSTDPKNSEKPPSQD